MADRVVMANQLGARAIGYVLDEINRDPAFDFYSLVDSVALVNRLAEAARRVQLKRPLQLIVEGGFVGGRTGCRQLEEALAVAAAVKANEPSLSLRGVAGYEGLIRADTPEEAERLVDRFLDYLVAIAVACDRSYFGPGIVLLTAGGSTFYDLVANRFARPRSIALHGTDPQRLLSHPRLRRICRQFQGTEEALAGGRPPRPRPPGSTRSVGLCAIAA